MHLVRASVFRFHEIYEKLRSLKIVMRVYATHRRSIICRERERCACLETGHCPRSIARHWYDTKPNAVIDQVQDFVLCRRKTLSQQQDSVLVQNEDALLKNNGIALGQNKALAFSRRGTAKCEHCLTVILLTAKLLGGSRPVWLAISQHVTTNM